MCDLTWHSQRGIMCDLDGGDDVCVSHKLLLHTASAEAPHEQAPVVWARYHVPVTLWNGCAAHIRRVLHQHLIAQQSKCYVF